MNVRTVVKFVGIVYRQLRDEVNDLRKLPMNVRQLRREFDIHRNELSLTAHMAEMWKITNGSREMCLDCGMHWNKGDKEEHFNYNGVKCPRLVK